MNDEATSSGEPKPDMASVVPLSDSQPPGQDKDFKDTHRRARQFLQSFKWVAAIDEEYLGAAIENIVCIFLFKITPARAGVDSWIWVVVGDIPPAYLTCDECKTPYEALDGYIGAMEQWVIAARAGKSVERLIPVNVPPTAKNAEMLGSRLKFLGEKVLPMLKE